MYLDYEDYKKINHNSEITEENFEFLEKRAEIDINALTFNRIADFEQLTSHQQWLVKLAMALQINFIYSNIDLLDGVLSSYSIGGVSINLDTSKAFKINGVATTNEVNNALMQTGLCYRGLDW